MLVIRPATLSDLPAITEIYNKAVLTTTATFDTEPKSETNRRVWFDEHDARHPILVAESEGVVIGWASLSRWSDRLAYADTAEISLYVKSEYRGLGVGKQLIRQIVEAGQQAGLHTLIARIADGNEVSIHLHKTVGFELVGVMRQVGRKFGRLLDVHLMQKIYP
jgi:phosphinothricin acetyltransferase